MGMSVGLVGDVKLSSGGVGRCREVLPRAGRRETPAWEVRLRVLGVGVISLRTFVR